MNFHHVLPSNTSPETFPQNHASSYSTPIDNPHILRGQWEVGLMSMTHSNCIDTFANDEIVITEFCKDYRCLETIDVPIKIPLSQPETKTRKGIINHFVREFETKLPNLLILQVTDKLQYFCRWKVLSPKYFFILSPGLQKAFGLWNDVLTSIDDHPLNYDHIKDNMKVEEKSSYVILVPKTYQRHEISLKKVNEEIMPQTLIDRFNKFVRVDGIAIAHMSITSGSNIVIEKYTNEYVLFCSESLEHALTYRQAATYRSKVMRFVGHNFSDVFKDKWFVTLHKLNEDNIQSFPKLVRRVSLDRQQFFSHEKAVQFLNEKLNDKRIEFSCDSRQYLQVSIKAEDLTIEFGDDLRDIFAFDANTYTKLGSHVASGKFSLSRRIQYLYIYANICGMTRIGDTQSPLLAAIPFNPKACKLLTEKTFKVPMYVPVVQDRISQIDIGIYDDAGKLVPFHKDAITALRLHFREK